MILNDTTHPLLPPFLLNGFDAVIGEHRRGMALGLMQFQTRPETIPVTVRPKNRLRPSPDYLMWALTLPSEQLPESDSDLHNIVQSFTEDWHADLRALLAACDTANIASTSVRLTAPVAPGETTDVTLLSDNVKSLARRL
ncbi:MAG TPA: hypothetical protein VF201_04155 [Nitrolancea sp.]